MSNRPGVTKCTLCDTCSVGDQSCNCGANWYGDPKDYPPEPKGTIAS